MNPHEIDPRTEVDAHWGGDREQLIAAWETDREQLIARANELAADLDHAERAVRRLGSENTRLKKATS